MLPKINQLKESDTAPKNFVRIWKKQLMTFFLLFSGAPDDFCHPVAKFVVLPQEKLLQTSQFQDFISKIELANVPVPVLLIQLYS